MGCDFLIVNAYDRMVLARIEKDRLLDAQAINLLAGELLKLVDRHPKISLVVDCEAVTALSSAMLGKLVALVKQVKACKGRMVLAGVNVKIMPLFQVTKLDKVLDFAPTAQEAIGNYRRKPL